MPVVSQQLLIFKGFKCEVLNTENIFHYQYSIFGFFLNDKDFEKKQNINGASGHIAGEIDFFE